MRMELARRAAAAGIDMHAGRRRRRGDARGRRAMARPGDRVVVFGSFHTVGPALVALGVPL